MNRYKQLFTERINSKLGYTILKEEAFRASKLPDISQLEFDSTDRDRIALRIPNAQSRLTKDQLSQYKVSVKEYIEWLRQEGAIEYSFMDNWNMHTRQVLVAYYYGNNRDTFVSDDKYIGNKKQFDGLVKRLQKEYARVEADWAAAEIHCFKE